MRLMACQAAFYDQMEMQRSHYTHQHYVTVETTSHYRQ